jgi:hypothetical protein
MRLRRPHHPHGGRGAHAELFKRELKTLLDTWKQIQKKAKSVKAPALVHREAGLTRGIIRDIFTNKVDSLTVDDREVHEEIRQYLKGIDPDLMKRVHSLRRAAPAVRQVRRRGGDPGGVPATRGPPVGRLPHHRAHRGPGLRGRQHRAATRARRTRRRPSSRPTSMPPARSPASSASGTSAASSWSTSSTWRRRPTRTGSSRSCAPTSTATAPAPAPSRSPSSASSR